MKDIDIAKYLMNNDVNSILRAPPKPSDDPENCNSRVSNGKAVVSFHIDGMSDADLDKISKAERLLVEVGIKFDTGLGFGNRDWVFDKLLVGGHVKVSKNFIWHGNCTCPWDADDCTCGFADTLEKQLEDVDERQCVGCGCTDYNACSGGCEWVSLDPPTCSNCDGIVEEEE